MYYSFSCPKCGKSITVYDNEPNPEYDAALKLPDLVKQHYGQWHKLPDLLLTDQELLDAVKAGVKKSDTLPEE